jgi:hypothetical protein
MAAKSVTFIPNIVHFSRTWLALRAESVHSTPVFLAALQ